MMGEMKRSSDPRPLVASHQSSTTTPIAPMPTSRRVIGGGESRSVRSDGLPAPGARRGVDDDSAGIYLGAAVASAGYTLISTRRFFALLSGSDESAGRSHPMPAVENWFGCSDGNLRTSACFTEFARFADSS